MDVTIEKIKTYKDRRGIIGEILTSADIKKNKNIFGHLFFATLKGKRAIRGNHYHERQHEYYIVLEGKIKVILEDIKSKKRKSLILSSSRKKFKKFRIGPKIAHASYALSNSAIVVCYYKYPYGEKNKDTIEYRLI